MAESISPIWKLSNSRRMKRPWVPCVSVNETRCTCGLKSFVFSLNVSARYACRKRSHCPGHLSVTVICVCSRSHICSQGEKQQLGLWWRFTSLSPPCTTTTVCVFCVKITMVCNRNARNPHRRLVNGCLRVGQFVLLWGEKKKSIMELIRQQVGRDKSPPALMELHKHRVPSITPTKQRLLHHWLHALSLATLLKIMIKKKTGLGLWAESSSEGRRFSSVNFWCLTRYPVGWAVLGTGVEAHWLEWNGNLSNFPRSVFME